MAKRKTTRSKSTAKKSTRSKKSQSFDVVSWLLYSPLIVGEILVIATVYAGHHEGVSWGTSSIEFVVGTVFIWAVFTWVSSRKTKLG